MHIMQTNKPMLPPIRGVNRTLAKTLNQSSAPPSALCHAEIVCSSHCPSTMCNLYAKYFAGRHMMTIHFAKLRLHFQCFGAS